MNGEGGGNTERRSSSKSLRLPVIDNDSAPANGEVSRRSMLQFLGASAALALGGAGCQRKPAREIVSRAESPEYARPGKTLQYSTTWTEGPFAYGLMVAVVDGRPVKIEGNPDHPVNQGASSAAMQAALLSLYDPDRLRSPKSGRSARTPLPWDLADRRIVDALRAAGSVILITRQLGPAEHEVVDAFSAACGGKVRHLVCESVDDLPRRDAWKKVYGTLGEPVPVFDAARVVLSLDDDFLGAEGPALEHIRRFAASRAVGEADSSRAEVSRLYVAESRLSLTGSNADHRIRLRPSAMAALANALRAALEGDGSALARFEAKHVTQADGVLAGLAEDLAANRGSAVVVAGSHLPAAVHAAVALLNRELRAHERALVWNPEPRMLATPRDEVSRVAAEGAEVVLSLGANPVYDWVGTGIDSAIARAKLSVGHGLHADETLESCQIALPSHHALESWNDASAGRGIQSIAQPLIGPLFDSRQEAESLLRWTQALTETADGAPAEPAADWHHHLRQRWEKRLGTNAAQPAALRTVWEELLRTGVVTTSAPVTFPEVDEAAATALSSEGAGDASGAFEVTIHPHYAVYDGRFANNGWLQELPDPISKLVWDNAAAISPATARELGADEGDLVRVTVGGAQVELPVLIQPGTADRVVVLTLGHGRKKGGTIAEDAGGANVAVLLGAENPAAPRVARRAEVAKVGGHHRLVRTQKTFSLHDRPLVLDGTVQEFRRDRDLIRKKLHLPEMVDLYEDYDYSKGSKWAMAIDLGSCVGCNACVTACDSENNVPFVGRDECGNGREMHWLRIDRYAEGDSDNPKVHHQPMLCQHCDHAPCENVCPVNATSHSPDGLNQMTYNRCVGTRYCSNNCPYKVRHFNFRRYQESQLRDPVQELRFNPQVTVRGIGVMEKCTFCIQRIQGARYAAGRETDENARLADGAVRTACQQACPAKAITFGDINDPESEISKAAGSRRAFKVLEELNVKPNVSYLARLRNPKRSSS